MSNLNFFSFIIPVVNEGNGINPLIEHLQKLAGDNKIELIVVDGDPLGSTVKEIKDGSVVQLISEKGRGVQMNRGAGLATGEMLIFLHADTRLPPRAFDKIRLVMGNPECVGGAFDLAIASDRPIFRIIERAASLRSRFMRIPFGDQAIFLRRSYFSSLGGYKSISTMEDVELMGRVKKRGDKICIIHDKAMTSARRWEKEGVVSCTLRNWLIQILYYAGVSPSKLANFYPHP